MAKRLTKTTKNQYEDFLNFVKENRIILSEKTKPLEARKIQKLWEQFAENVNSKGSGPRKTAQQWRNIWNEWKMNTKRKSREIQQSLLGTGGGPPINKSMTDLENQLLELISLIRLGDPDIMHTSINSSDKTNEETIMILFDDPNVMVQSSEKEHFDIEKKNILTPLEINKNIEKSTDDTGLGEYGYEKTPNKGIRGSANTPAALKALKKDTTLTETRYSNRILSDACENYAEAQKSAVESKKLQAASLMEIGDALNKNACTLKEKNKIELMKLKFEYLKHFGTLDNFNQLEGTEI